MGATQTQREPKPGDTAETPTGKRLYVVSDHRLTAGEIQVTGSETLADRTGVGEEAAVVWGVRAGVLETIPRRIAKPRDVTAAIDDGAVVPTPAPIELLEVLD